MTRRQQMDALGIGVDSYNGLILVEIDGPPVVPLTPAEARRFWRFFERAYRDAFTDRDALRSPGTPRAEHNGDRKVEVKA